MNSNLDHFDENNTKFNDLEVGKTYKVEKIKTFESAFNRNYIFVKINDNFHLTVPSSLSRISKQLYVTYNGRTEENRMDFSFSYKQRENGIYNSV